MIAIQAMIVPCAAADDETAAQEQVAVLLEQLSADRLELRVEAERKLRQLGTDLLKQLPDPQLLRPSAAAAVQRIRTYLQQEQARQVLAPRRVSLTGMMRLDAAINAVSEQTGSRIDIDQLPEPTRDLQVAVDFSNVPFWSALESIEEQAGIIAVAGENRDSLRLRSRGDIERLPVQSVSSGPFRVSLLRVSERVDFTTPGRRLLRIVLQVLPEPRLNTLFVHVAEMSLAAVVATTNESLPPLSPAAQREIPVDRPGPILLSYDVLVPGGYEAERPESVDIRGRVEVELAAGQERFLFRNLDERERVVRRHGGVSVALEEVEHDNDELIATLRLNYDVDGPHFESHRSWVYHNDVALQIGDDHQLRPAEFETLSEGEVGAVLRYRFADVGELPPDAELVYTAPTLFTRVPVDFAFEGVSVEE